MPEESGQQRYCRNCGTEIRPGTSFCVSCGAPLRPHIQDPGPSPSRAVSIGRLGSYFAALRRGFGQFVGHVEATISGLSTGHVRQLPGNALEWFKNLPDVQKLVIAGIILLVLLVVLSPVALLLAALALLTISTIVVLRALRREPVAGWAVGAGVSLVLVLVFGGVASTIYGDGLLGGTGFGGTSQPNGGLAGNSDGGNVAFEQYDVRPEEEDYILQAVSIQLEVGELMDRQIEVHDFCVEVCIPEHVVELSENTDRASDLVDEASAMTPPPGYEDSHQSFVSGVETAYEIVGRLQYQMIGHSELQSLAAEVVVPFARAVDLAPASDRKFYVQTTKELISSMDVGSDL